METLHPCTTSNPSPAAGSPRAARRPLPDPSHRLLRRVGRRPAAHDPARLRSRCSRRSRRARAARSSPFATCPAGSATRSTPRTSATSSRPSATALRRTSRLRGALHENAELTRVVALDDAHGIDALQPVHRPRHRRPPNLWFSTGSQVDAGSSAGVRAQPGDRRRRACRQGQSVVVRRRPSSRSSPTTRAACRLEGASTPTTPACSKPRRATRNDLLLQLSAAASRGSRRASVVVTRRLPQSSRLDSLFPPGIPIGRVTKADPEELDVDQQVHVKPFADLRHLDFVQMLTNPNDARWRPPSAATSP